jgi:hypothetical protein
MFVMFGWVKDVKELDARRARQLGTAADLPALAGHLEELQLAGKTEVQRRFLLAQREQRETAG